MAELSLYEIFLYWRDKAITRSGRVTSAARPCCADVIPVVEDPAYPACWACGPPIPQGENDLAGRHLQYRWNHARGLQRAHILARSQGGADDRPDNRFLLCACCHAESPDTVNPENFFGWVYYIRTNEPAGIRIKRELEKAMAIKGLSPEQLDALMSRLPPERVPELHRLMVDRGALHGSFMSYATKMLGYLDALLELAGRD